MSARGSGEAATEFRLAKARADPAWPGLGCVDLARHLRVSVTTVQREADCGRMKPTLVVGRMRRWCWQDVEKLVAAT